MIALHFGLSLPRRRPLVLLTDRYLLNGYKGPCIMQKDAQKKIRKQVFERMTMSLSGNFFAPPNLCASRLECVGCCHCQRPINPAPCEQRYFRPQPKTGLQARECGTNKIKTASDLFGVLVVCDEHRAEVLEFANILQGLTIKQDGLALLTRDEC